MSVQFLEELNLRNTLQKLAPIFLLIRSKTKTNCDSFEHIFMHVVTARRKFYISSSFDCIVFVPCDCLEWLMCFGFTTLKWFKTALDYYMYKYLNAQLVNTAAVLTYNIYLSVTRSRRHNDKWCWLIIIINVIIRGFYKKKLASTITYMYLVLTFFSSYNRTRTWHNYLCKHTVWAPLFTIHILKNTSTVCYKIIAYGRLDWLETGDKQNLT